jgi:carbonic anhydrase
MEHPTMTNLHFFMILLGLATPQVLAAQSEPAIRSSQLSSDSTLAELKRGNARFATGKGTECSMDTVTRERLSQGQAPNAIVLSCSDSRVPPEQIFDQALGQIFTVRVAGNVINDQAIASIEYALTQLGSKLIVVLGHESCGAIKAALNHSPGADAGSPHLEELITEIQGNLGNVTGPKTRTLRKPVKKNVESVVDDLIRRSKIVKSRIDSGQVKIVRSIYGLHSGKVEFWN